MRDKTERPEAITAGVAQLVGTSAAQIESAVSALLDAKSEHAATTCRTNPYGDGRAAERIVAILKGESVVPFEPGRTTPH